MPHTSGEAWPTRKGNPEEKVTTLVMAMWYEKDGIVHGFKNAKIKVVIEPRLAGTDRAAVNEIFPGVETAERLAASAEEVQYIAIIRIRPDVAEASQVIRKEAFAREFVEVAMGLADPAYRKRRRTINENLQASRILIREKGHLVWEETKDDKLTIQRGLEALLLSPDSIRKYLENEKGLTKEGYLTSVEERGMPTQRTADELADYFNVRPEIARDRLNAFMYGGNGSGA